MNETPENSTSNAFWPVLDRDLVPLAPCCLQTVFFATPVLDAPEEKIMLAAFVDPSRSKLPGGSLAPSITGGFFPWSIL